MSERPESEFVSKGHPCPECGSSDGVAQYSDGHSWCFAHSGPGPRWDGSAPTHHQAPKKAGTLELQELVTAGKVVGIKSRGLSQATCKKWDYRVRARPDGTFDQLAIYRDPDGTPTGVKVRPEDKDKMHWEGGSAKGNLWGRHMWPGGGLKLTIVEGEIDAMTVSQANSHKYPVVSVPNGAAEAAKAIAKNLEWVLSFKEIVLGFDMDEPGQKAARECAELLPAGRVKLVKWTRKDANAMLMDGDGDKITLCVYQAETYRPDGIIDARDLTEECMEDPTWGLPWPWPAITKWTYGRRHGEIYCLGAGYGIGKTDFLSEVIACTLTGEDKVGTKFVPEGVALFGYEAGAAKSKKAIAGKIVSRRFHLPNEEDEELWTKDELAEAMARMDGPIWDAGGKLFINDSRGKADWESVKSRARFLARAEGVKHIFIDPISALVEEEGEGSDERKFLDHMVREAAKLCVELDVCIYLFSHLTRPAEGPSHEEGGQVRGKQFRGSNALGMFVDFLLGMERHTQHEDPSQRSVSTIRVVKDRLSGNYNGETTHLVYDSIGGTLDLPAPSPFDVAPDSIPPLEEVA